MPLYLLNAEIAVQMANSNPIFFECVSLFGISLAIPVLLNRGDDHSISGIKDQARIFGVAERRPRSLTFLLRPSLATFAPLRLGENRRPQ
jgi:hypothetical protein